MSGSPADRAGSGAPAAYHDTGTPLPLEAEELWEINSGWWQRSFTEGADPEYTEQIIPLLRHHLEQAGPRRVLDIGCGEGQLSRVAAGLRRRGAGGGGGPDRGPAAGGARAAAGAPAPVKAESAARPRAPGPERAGPGAAYARAAAGSLPFPDASFDAAFACLVFEHIEGTVEALAEVGRVLRPGGTFLLFLNHPLLQAPGSGWVDDHILGEQYWRIGPYLVEHHGVEEVDKNVWVPFVHRPLSVYVNGLVAAGLYLCGMVEPAPPAGFLKRAHEYEEAAAFPRLLCCGPRSWAVAPQRPDETGTLRAMAEFVVITGLSGSGPFPGGRGPGGPRLVRDGQPAHRAHHQGGRPGVDAAAPRPSGWPSWSAAMPASWASCKRPSSSCERRGERVSVLFLEASDEVLVRRFEGTRGGATPSARRASWRRSSTSAGAWTP